MKGIDPKWVVFLGIALMIEQGIGQGSVSLTNVVPLDWIPYVKGWSALLAFIGTTVMTGMSAYSSKDAGMMIPTPSVPPAVKALIGFLIIGVALSFAMPAQAANGVSFPKLKPLSLPLQKTVPAAPAANPPTSNDPIADLMDKLEKIKAEDVAAIVVDINAADVDAGTVVTPAIPATPAVPAVIAPDGVTVVTPAVPANPGAAAVVKDPISHACYPAAVKFLQSLPVAAKLTGKFVGVQLFQEKRDFIAQLQAGLPTYLKLGCAPLLGDEINTFIQIMAMVGIKILPAAATALMPALAPITLPAMTLTP
jgi:hypothetical protein